MTTSAAPLPRPAPGLPGPPGLPGRRQERPPLLREVYGRLLRRLRTRQGRTLADVAGEAGVSIAYLSEIERGLKEPSSEVLAAVCLALGSSVAGLVGAAHVELRGLVAEEEPVGLVLDLAARQAPLHELAPAPLAGTGTSLLAA